MLNSKTFTLIECFNMVDKYRIVRCVYFLNVLDLS